MPHLIRRILQTALVAATVVTFGALYMSTPAAAQSGKALFNQKGCAACHGPGGAKPLQPAYPKLAGQNADYIVVQLKAFKTQQRKSGQSALMWGMAAQLNDKEMTAIAKYLASEKGI
ncbi:MAG TPA: cytochrome c [bacterium]|nr:cytochrome c [bacterium]